MARPLVLTPSSALQSLHPRDPPAAVTQQTSDPGRRHSPNASATALQVARTGRVSSPPRSRWTPPASLRVGSRLPSHPSQLRGPGNPRAEGGPRPGLRGVRRPHQGGGDRSPPGLRGLGSLPRSHPSRGDHTPPPDTLGREGTDPTRHRG